MEQTPAAPAVALSIVVPAYDEAEVLPAFAARLRAVCSRLDADYEVIVVDDGSTDETMATLRTLSADWPQLRPVRLRGNVGHQNALTAGLELARGADVVSIDADLQDPPEVIPRLLAARAAGIDVVYAQRSDRSSDSWGKRASAGLYYRLVRRLTGVDLVPHVGDFRLLSRAAVDELGSLPRNDRVYRLLVPSLCLPSSVVAYSRDRRAAGVSKYPVRRMIRLAYDSLTNFSVRPLTLAVSLGLLSGLSCLGLMAWALADRLASRTVPGWTSVCMAVLGVGAAQLVCTGLIGEYVAKLVRSASGRPPYSIARGESGVDEITAASRLIQPLSSVSE